jgi:hypothetical protein
MTANPRVAANGSSGMRLPNRRAVQMDCLVRSSRQTAFSPTGFRGCLSCTSASIGTGVDQRIYRAVDFDFMSTTIRVSERTRDRFAKLANTTGRPMTQLLDEAADALERQVFFDQFSARYDQLRTDPVAWAEVERERALESGALRDTSA